MKPAEIIITDDLIEHGASHRGGWSKKQFAALGVAWPPRKGWRRALIGRCISASAAERFLALRPTTPFGLPFSDAPACRLCHGSKTVPGPMNATGRNEPDEPCPMCDPPPWPPWEDGPYEAHVPIG